MTDISFNVQVGGQQILPMRFSITGSSYGSVGHATIRTSLAFLQGAGIDLYSLTTSASGLTVVTVDAMLGGGSARIFGGEYLSCTWDMDNDCVDIHARSWAGVLVDQKRVLTKIGNAIQAVLAPLIPGQVTNAGISNQNQKLSNIVTSIADEFGFTPVLHLSNGDPTIGTLYGSTDQSFMPVPQSLWSILNQLARDTGYVVYDTPNKELVFGLPGVGEDPLYISYKQSFENYAPAKRVHLEHHPRRNSTFRVLVISYDPSTRQMAIGRANYVGRNFANSNGLTSGLSSGAAASSNDAKLNKLNQGTGAVPLYTFHHDGLTLTQATDLAAAIATDIAKRELIISVMIDGYPAATPTQQVQLAGQLPSEFTGATFYVSGYTHTFVMPSERHHGSDTGGWWTEIKALNIPTEALAQENAG